MTAQRDSDRLYLEYHVTSILLQCRPGMLLVTQIDMESSHEALIKTNADLKKQLDTTNTTLLALQEQISRLTEEGEDIAITGGGASSTESQAAASSSSSQPTSAYNTRSKKGR